MEFGMNMMLEEVKAAYHILICYEQYEHGIRNTDSGGRYELC